MRFAARLSSPARQRVVGGLIAGLIALCPVGPAWGRLVQADLARVAAAPGPDARAPADLPVTDAATGERVTLGRALGGRPVLLLPVDYTCGNVCDPMVSMLADALAATGLPPADRALVLFGLDPRDGPAEARRMIGDTLGDRAEAERPRILVADEPAVQRLTGALGYGFVYDAATDSFAHPAAAMLLTADGRVARVLSPLALNGRDLRLALAEAGEGRVGTLGDRLALLCYGFDAQSGVYTPLIRRILALAGLATIAAIALLILALHHHSRRRATTNVR